MMSGVHNSPNSLAAKLDMRRRVLAQVTPSRVLDAFCGPVGEMFSGAWHAADSYTGIDHEWRIQDGRRRFAADTLTVLRHIDLGPFNVFDVDAFGDPWTVALRLLRRPWAKGERGALVVTDGSALKTRFGSTSGAMSNLLGFDSTSCPPSACTADATHDMCLTAWLGRAKVRQLHRYTARSNGRQSARGVSATMRYSAVVFEGTG